MSPTSNLLVSALCLVLNSGFANAQGWTSLPVTVPENLTDLDYVYNHVQVVFGSPPQPVNLAIGVGATLLSAWSSGCAFCPSFTPFDPERSSTLKAEGDPWAGNDVDATGHWYNDEVGFGGLKADGVQFVMMEEMTTDWDQMLNGHLGLWANITSPRNNVFNQLWDQGALLNPVVGLRLDTIRPRLTIGALDPEDYEGTINWVELGSDSTPATGFRIDGIKGYNGSLIPSDRDELIATINSLARGIYIPPSMYEEYFGNSDYYGPTVEPIPTPERPTAYECDEPWNSMPPVPFTVTINGVDYPMEGPNNMIRQPSAVSRNCRVALYNTTSADPMDVYLALPFLRSVYVAYRFPTSDSDCPAYFGFAFLRGMGRTEEQIKQTPRSPAPRAGECLALRTATDSPATMSVDNQRGTGTYAVYGEEGKQVALVGANELKKRN